MSWQWLTLRPDMLGTFENTAWQYVHSEDDVCSALACVRGYLGYCAPNIIQIIEQTTEHDLDDMSSWAIKLD